MFNSFPEDVKYQNITSTGYWSWQPKWRGVAVTSSAYQRGYSTSGPVSTGMGDRLRRINYLSISRSHPDKLSLLPGSAGQEMNSSQSAVTSKGKYGSFHLCNLHVKWQVKLRDPS